MLESLQVIELDLMGRPEGEIPFLKRLRFSLGPEQEFPDDRFTVDVEDARHLSLRNAGTEMLSNRLVFVTLLLTVIGMRGGRGEVFFALRA